ncbi:L-serine dehydratase/L-threonine deaminase [Symbiodinium microadriaticum]|uniref:L-serine ammonia-lyase n=1 Tax=Symbiodinium microadriaticum TaxID=2951 RepID=A0A1Q9CMM6_SYMMI|nr:L-serine dehydratase/L-threonine deaminase [Symbiodinium microadriaticum]
MVAMALGRRLLARRAFLTAGCTYAALQQVSRGTLRTFAGNACAAPHIETPLIHSEAFSKRLGAEVFLKLDLLQPSGSFKLRGIGQTVREAKQNGASCIVSSSGGNAGLAAAYAARACGLPCTESTWRGHASIVQELQSQLSAPPDAIVTCVGGGGLLMGILRGLEAAGWVAKSLGALRPSEAVFEKCRQLPSSLFASEVFSDAQALAACLRLADEHRLVVEPACGAALAAVTENCESLRGMRKIVVEICGGAVVNSAQLSEWADQVKAES